MSFNAKKELKIGAFIIAVAAASFLIINFLKDEDIFNREYEVYSYYDNLQGLVPTGPVFIKGYNVGSVSSVEYDSDSSRFTVVCSIRKEFPVPADSKMTIYSVDIMGSKGIRIDMGESEVYARDGALLKSETEPDMISSLTSSLGPLAETAKNALDGLNVTVGKLNSVLCDENVNSVKNTLLHLEKTVGNVEELSAAIGGKSAELSAFIDNLNTVAVQLGAVIAKADTTVAGISEIAGKIDGAEIQETIVSFRNLLDKIQDKNGTLGKLMGEDKIYSSFDSLLSDVDSLVRKIEANPKKYIRISVF